MVRGVTSRDVAHPTRQPVPAAYCRDLARRIRALGTEGRGDDARGRYLASLYALEWASTRGLLDYRPNRDPGRWLLLLLDVGGARAGMPPDQRLALTLDAFLERLADIELPLLARMTREELVTAVARTLAAPALLVAPLVGNMSVACVLWRLAVSAGGGETGDKHPQARHFRRVLRQRIDDAWSQELDRIELRGPPSLQHVLAALPIAFGLCARTVRASLRRGGDDIDQTPFAVFYALVTDARRGGRVWRPPDRYVEGGSYDRASFELAVGQALEGVRSRKRRERRSSALAELGLSAIFPTTVMRIDRWLEQGRYPVLELDAPPLDPCEQDWYAWARTQRSLIRSLHEHIIETIGMSERRAPTERSSSSAAAHLAVGARERRSSA
jgi:hypothetical protein